MENKIPEYSSLEAVLSFFQTRPDVGGFVVQKTDDKIEFDTYFSDDFLGSNQVEAYSTMIAVIAAMRSISDDLTKRVAAASNITEDKIRQNIADIYYQLKKDKEITKDTGKNLSSQ